MNDAVTSASSQVVVAELTEIVGERNLTVDPRQLRSGSRDSYHFSPVLTPALDGKQADVIVWPRTQAELEAVIATAVRHRVPVVPRGAGTGNYGQGVPLQGGVLVNTRRMNRIVEIDGDQARVEAGCVLYEIERAAAGHGAELRMFPSTVPIATAGGFVSGGSGGVGSISWGMLWEADNVRSVTLLTAEDPPRRLTLGRAELAPVLHNCGLTGFVTEITFALAPRRAWQQYICAFPELSAALAAGEALARNDDVAKRLVSVFEWPLPSFFLPLVKRGACPDRQSVVFLYADAGPETIEPLLRELGGRMTLHMAPQDGDARGRQIYDYSWNHTTQWAMKNDPGLTYLQERFEIDRLEAQIAERKARFPGETIEHIEFTRARGEVVASGLGVVRFRDAERLSELMTFSESIGIRIADPHTWFLDDDRRWYDHEMLTAKETWDPHGLMNPGHLRALEPR